MTEQEAKAVNALMREIKDFSLPELNAVLFVAQRLAMGRKKYGPLNPMDGRNWRRETAEELADALVYIASDQQRADGTFSHSVLTATTADGYAEHISQLAAAGL